MEVINTTSTVDPLNMYDKLNSFILNPVVIIIVLLVILAYFVLFSSLGNNQKSTGDGINMNDSGSSGSGSGGKNILGIIVVIILVLLIVVNAFQYFFSINIIGYISGLFSKDKNLNIVVEENDNTNENTNLGEATYKPMPTISISNKQVFNIPGNYYTYDDATAICKAYGGNLASYKQIEDAYKSGGEWCNYGWSDEQMALFPTQQNTYNNLQNKTGHEHDCGRPGINGGYIANPNVKFGVNCYGYKPKITEEEEELMKTISPYPETKEEQDFQTRVDFWKNKINSVLLSPFNYTSWEEI